MHISEDTGLLIAVADVDEALETDWKRHRGEVELVRVSDPPTHAWPALREAGFLPRPSWLTWVAHPGTSEAEFMGGLRRKQRQSVQAARRHVSAQGLRIEARPLTEPLLDEFLVVYRAQMARMRNALPVAVQQRSQLLEAAADMTVVSAADVDRLVAACIVQHQPQAGLVRLRFSAVDERSRSQSLTRALYMEAIQSARDLGAAQVSLGNDPNIYGHVVAVGLFEFKARLGFTPVPSQTVHPHRGTDCADLILGQCVLSDPTLLLSYASDTAEAGAPRELTLEVFTTSDTTDSTPYAGLHEGRTRLHVLPAGP